MPQMAPLNWLFLFMIFASLYGASMTKIYFSSSLKMNQQVHSSNKSELNSTIQWKW